MLLPNIYLQIRERQIDITLWQQWVDFTWENGNQAQNLKANLETIVKIDVSSSCWCPSIDSLLVFTQIFCVLVLLKISRWFYPLQSAPCYHSLEICCSVTVRPGSEVVLILGDAHQNGPSLKPFPKPGLRIWEQRPRLYIQKHTYTHSHAHTHMHTHRGAGGLRSKEKEETESEL